jgi:hypothetical protein
VAEPAWIDAALSAQIDTLLQGGESQAVEFKAALPKQASELAKPIASFATSNDGLILLGVSDDGRVVGLPGITGMADRDDLMRRIAGIGKGVAPPVRLAFKWAQHGDSLVLGIQVGKGREPLYYADHHPYLRDGAASRPAAPGEVIEAVRVFLDRGGGDEADAPGTAVINGLAALLPEVLSWADTDPEMLDLIPWLDQWTMVAGQAASTLRDLAAEDWSHSEGIDTDLHDTASALDAVADFRHVIGGGQSFRDTTAAARASVASLMDRLVSPVPLGEADIEAIRQQIGKSARKLTDMWSRAAAEPFGGLVDAAMKEAGRIGRTLMRFSYYRLPFLAEDGTLKLRDVGRRLLSIEGTTMCADGGESERGVIAEGQACTAELIALLDLVRMGR